jgi:hypothetical protein
VDAADPTPVHPPSAAGEALRSRTQERFALADLYKPRMDDETELDPYLAPLIYVEAPGGAAPSAARFEGGAPSVDPELPTVYWAEDVAVHGEGEHRRLAFVWFPSSGTPALQGVRTTFDADGFPAVYEVLSDTSGLDVLFVAKGLEERAASHFGEPLDGRRFAVEGTGGHAVVAGVLTDAPAPMGPYVYQAARAGDVVALACRCSPTQVDELREMREYELVPLQDLEAFGRADELFAGSRLRLPPGF